MFVYCECFVFSGKGLCDGADHSSRGVSQCVCVCVCVCVIKKLQQCCDLGRSFGILPEGFRREQSVTAFTTVTVKLCFVCIYRV